MFEQLRNLFFEYAPWLIFMPWLLALGKQSNYSPPLKTIFYYLTLAAVTHVLCFTLWKLKKNNLIVLHIYTVAEYLILLRYYHLLLRGYLHSAIFITLAFAFTFFSVADTLLIEDPLEANTYSRTVEALILIFLSVSWFVKSVSEVNANIPNNRSLNYITGGLLIYFAGSVMLFSFVDNVNQLTRPFRMNVWSIHTLLLVILYILISIGLWKHNKK
jgi:hypothetical protein